MTDTGKLTFEEAKALLDALEIEYQLLEGYRKSGPAALPLFKAVRLPFTPEEWCSLCMNEGENYIGGCCGNSSAAQDIIEYIFRQGGGWIDIRDVAGGGLEALAAICSHHDEMLNAKVEWAVRPDVKALLGPSPKDVWTTLGVWDKITLLWHLVRDNYDAEAPWAQHTDEDLPTEKQLFEKAARTVEKVLRGFAYDRLFKMSENNPQYEAQFRMAVHRFIPALNTLYAKLHTLDFPPTDYLALVDSEIGPEAVAENGHGLCLFPDEASLKDLLVIWRRTEVKRPRRGDKKLDRFRVRKVRISMDKGLEFISEPMPLPT